MSRLRTSSPWTTPSTPLGARILSEEPATLDAVPTMSLVEMEAELSLGPTGPSCTSAASSPQPSGRRATSCRQGVAVARRALTAVAVLVALAGCTGGVAAGAGRPSRLGPASAGASPASEVASSSASSEAGSGRVPTPGGGVDLLPVAAVLGAGSARHAPSAGVPDGEAGPTDTGAVLLPASAGPVPAEPADGGAGPAPVGAAGLVGGVVGQAEALVAPTVTTLASP